MAELTPLNVVIMWHMHQPHYIDPQSGKLRLPWTRLHALKDYLDMVQLVELFPDLRLTFNLTPVLMEQLAGYADGTLTDEAWDLCQKPAAVLTEMEQKRLHREAFFAHLEHMIKVHPRYHELWELTQAGSHRWLEQDNRDLQVWWNLAWIDPWLRSQRPALRRLVEQGRGFTEEDKAELLSEQLAILREVLPTYRRLQDAGTIEVTTSPYAHPILPLLCDPTSARESIPRTELPDGPWQDGEEDARWHLERGVQVYEKYMGRPPRGLWPSEGSVSEAILPLVYDAGFTWLATDEEMLFRTLGVSKASGVLYQPYQSNDGRLSIVFRDRMLSDLIGFTYQDWEPGRAAADLLGHLRRLRRHLGERPHAPLATLILDGENAWEYYANDGRDFLMALYQGLVEEPLICTTTVSDVLDEYTPAHQLNHLAAGSWIYGNFATWIGHPAKNRAWSALREARAMVREVWPALSTDVREALRTELLLAEGSDWFWWYGDDHSAATDADFDELFRSHLRELYRLVGKDAPRGLEEMFGAETPVRDESGTTSIHQDASFSEA